MKNVLKIKPFFTDERGEMSHLLPHEASITSALLITSKKGSTRANHYHKKDIHYVYILKGEMIYTYKELNKNSKKKSRLVKEGELVISPPKTVHAMKFLKDTVFLALTTEPRDQKRYEKDTVRVDMLKDDK